MLRMNLSEEGMIKELGYDASYQFQCPSFINFENTNLRCIDINDINNEASWTSVEKSPRQIVEQRIERGRQVVIRFLSENASTDISTNDSIAQMQAFQNVKMALDVGDLGTAIYLISQIPDATFVVTPGYATAAERKQSYITELGQPL